MLFGRLADVNGINGTAVGPLGGRDRGGKWTASELDSRNGRNGTYDVANSFEQCRAHQHVAFGQEHGRLTVDEEVTLSSGAQHEVTATESAFPEKLEQSIHRGVPPRPGRSCNRELTGSAAWARASWYGPAPYGLT